MYQYIFTNKWFSRGIVFLIVFSIGCVLWYKYYTTLYRQEAAKIAELLHQTDSASQQVVDAPVESSASTAEKPINVTTNDVSDMSSPDGTLREEDDSIIPEVPEISPHGFGPFPEVPEDYHGMVVWRNIGYYNLSPSDQRAFELLNRVLIKLWSEDKRNFKGGKIDGQNGKVYPNYSDTVYSTVKNLKYPDGTVEPYVTHQVGSAPVGVDLLNPPSYIKVLNYESSGIDPFQYLNLP